MVNKVIENNKKCKFIIKSYQIYEIIIKINISGIIINITTKFKINKTLTFKNIKMLSI